MGRCYELVQDDLRLGLVEGALVVVVVAAQEGLAAVELLAAVALVPEAEAAEDLHEAPHAVAIGLHLEREIYWRRLIAEVTGSKYP